MSFFNFGSDEPSRKGGKSTLMGALRSLKPDTRSLKRGITNVKSASVKLKKDASTVRGAVTGAAKAGKALLSKEFAKFPSRDDRGVITGMGVLRSLTKNQGIRNYDK